MSDSKKLSALFTALIWACCISAQCTTVGDVKLLWGTGLDDISTATPMGFTGTSAAANLSTRGTIVTSTEWVATSCPDTSAPATNSTTTTTVGAIFDVANNLCLTISALTASSGLTLHRSKCLNLAADLPFDTQSFVFITEKSHNAVAMVGFLGATEVVADGTPTRFVPSLSGGDWGIGATLDLAFLNNGFLPNTTTHTMLVSFAEKPAAAVCTVAGNVTLLWGTSLDDVTTALPLGFSTNETVLETRSTIPSTNWVATTCPTLSTNDITVGAIVDTAKNLCLTVVDTGAASGLNITRATCINNATVLPDATQNFAFRKSASGAVSVVSFVGQSRFVAQGTATSFVPSLVGGDRGVGATLRLDYLERSFLLGTTTPTMLVSFVPPPTARCAIAGTVTLFWGTSSDDATSALPLGFVTGDSAIQTRATVSSTVWTATACTSGSTSDMTVGAIVDESKNFCLTVLDTNATSGLTITRATCINGPTVLPDASQNFAFSTTASGALSVVAFVGQSTFVGQGIATNYIPSAVGGNATTGVGADIDLSFVQGGFSPESTTKTLLVSLAPPPPPPTTQCAIAGNVTLLWGTSLENVTTASPLGFVTGDSAMQTRATISSTVWTASVCTSSTTNQLTVGAIVDESKNFCLTVLSTNATSGLTITRATCINAPSVLPDATQNFAFSTTASGAVSVVAFVGASQFVAKGAATNYIPSAVGGNATTGVGAELDLSFVQGGFSPGSTTKTLLVAFS